MFQPTDIQPTRVVFIVKVIAVLSNRNEIMIRFSAREEERGRVGVEAHLSSLSFQSAEKGPEENEVTGGARGGGVQSIDPARKFTRRVPGE